MPLFFSTLCELPLGSALTVIGIVLVTAGQMLVHGWPRAGRLENSHVDSEVAALDYPDAISLEALSLCRILFSVLQVWVRS